MAVNYEARVLSALLKRQDMIAILGEPLDSMMVTCGDIWQFVRSYYQKNRELPTPKVVEEMFPDDFAFEEDIEGTTKHHIEVLRTVTIKARTEELLEKSQKNLRKGEFSPQKIVEHLSKRLSEVQREMGISRTVDIRDVDNALEHYDKIRRIAEEHDGQPGISFGFKQMDDNYPTGMAPGHLGIIMGYSGKGKSNDVDSIVYDKNGPKRFGDLKPGDYVMGRNGQETRVLEIHPQGVIDAYKITFTDGTSVVASGDHLWNIQTHKLRQTKYDQKYITVTTKDIIEKYLPREHGEVNQNGERSKTYHAYIPLCEPVEFEKKDLDIDPYLLGVMIANGSFSGDSPLTFTTNDSWIAKKVKDTNPQFDIQNQTKSSYTAERWVLHKARPIFEKTGFNSETRSSNKSIPQEYLYGSIEQRKDLLAGIIDCDSHLMGRNPEKSRPIYETASRQLMDDFAKLVRSLGGVVEEISSDERRKNTYYRARFWTPFNPYSLPRLVESYKPSYKPMRAVESIERLDDREMMCISVEAPDSLYLVDDFVVTHNTWFTIKLLVNAWLRGYPVLFINLEMSPEELRDRIYFLISQYTMVDFARASIDPNNFRAWAEDFMRDKPEFNIVGNDNFGDFSVDMVHAKIEQFKPAIVGLDYLSLFTDRAHSDQETTRMKNLSRQLKQLAMACQIPILAIAAVTGKDKKDRVNPPDVAQVAWSSGIEYDANFAIAVHTHMDARGQAEKTEIVCRKNRHGALYSFFVRMDLVNGIIEEIDEIQQMEMLLDEEDDDLSFLEKSPSEIAGQKSKV